MWNRNDTALNSHIFGFNSILFILIFIHRSNSAGKSGRQMNIGSEEYSRSAVHCYFQFHSIDSLLCEFINSKKKKVSSFSPWNFERSIEFLFTCDRACYESCCQELDRVPLCTET